MEAIVLCVDNSEWTRNGDYAPTRWQAQADAINFVAGVKIESHPETTVGVLTLAGKNPQIAVTPTQVRRGALDLPIGVDSTPRPTVRSFPTISLIPRPRYNIHRHSHCFDSTNPHFFQDLRKILNCMYETKIEGEIQISRGIQIAQLALKHRENKNQRQRIILFCGSPIQEEKVGSTESPLASIPPSRPRVWSSPPLTTI